MRRLEIAYDTETTGLKRHQDARMFLFGICDWNGDASVHRLESHDGKHFVNARRKLEWLWSDENRHVPKVMHNARFDIGMTEKCLGRSLYGHEIHETMALSHLFQNTHPGHGLGKLGKLLFNYSTDRDDVVDKYIDEENGLLNCPDYILDKYQADDAIRTMLLYRLFEPMLDEMGFRDEYEMERELVWTTLAIEDRGMMISEKECYRLIDWCRQKEQEALEAWYSYTRDRKRPTDEMIRHVLYKQQKLPVLKRTKKTNLPAVDATTLKELEEMYPGCEAFDHILRIRSYHKGRKAVENYLKQADSNFIIHPSIHPYGADTGRESCREPNLQNVSKDNTFRVKYPIPARRCFRPKPGYVNFFLDYAGIEWRLGVDASKDDELIAMVRRGDDAHSIVSELFYGDDWKHANKKKRKALRSAGKNGNFCKMYGGADVKLAVTLGLPLDVIIPRSKEYDRRFPGLARLARRIIGCAKRDSYVTTPFGRRLYTPESHAALNYLIQGSAASVLKRAQNRVHRYLEDATGGETGICLPIHDEIVIEWPRKRLKDAPDCLREIRKLMVDFPQFDVPMDVECKIATVNWNKTSKYKIPT